jgi:hypothetical protein
MKKYLKLFRNFWFTFAFLNSTAWAEECFHIALSTGLKEITVPSTINFLQTPHRDIATQPGFSLYHSGGNLALIGPACFLLDQDIVRHVDILGKLLGEPGGSGPIVELFGTNIVLDLNGHGLHSDRARAAVSADVGGKLNAPKNTNYTFKNGIIDIRGFGFDMSGWQYGGEPHNYKPGPDQLDTAIHWYGPNFGEFGDTNILIENLTIKSGGLAAYLVGRNNIIRHCHIEVEGHEAIALFGANNQLIDNEIIIKRTRPAPSKPTQPPPSLNLGSYYEEYAAIWIRDAPGLIIRGNKITIQGLAPAKEAILLINSPRVVIENNAVTGVEKLYIALDKNSSAYTHNNRKRFGKWPEN